MAKVFVSYNAHDKQWAEWLGQILARLGHTPFLHDWEPVTDIGRWMEDRLAEADSLLCVVSKRYLAATFSGWERRAAQWAEVSGRAGFLKLVSIEDCAYPLLLQPIKRCSLQGLDEAAAAAAFATYMTPGAPPAGRISFPGVAKTAHVPFPAA